MTCKHHNKDSPADFCSDHIIIIADITSKGGKSSLPSYLNKLALSWKWSKVIANLGFNGCQGRNISNYHNKKADE